MSPSASPLVEVRVITYKRPELLVRALRCLLTQTYTHWKAAVFDDSAGQEGRQVVESMADPRIEYRPNPQNLGMVGNLSKAFAPVKYFPESRYACVLEDDNLFGPELIERNVASMQQATSLPVLVRNYGVVDIHEDGTITETDRQPMREIWGDSPREITFDDRVIEAFFSYTLGTMSYFWDLNSKVDLSIKYELHNGAIAEGCRAISFRESCWYEPDPHSVFSRFICKNQTPRKERNDGLKGNRLARLSRLRLTRMLHRHVRREMKLPFTQLLKKTRSEAEARWLTLLLAEIGHLPALMRLRGGKAWSEALKAIPLRLLYEREHVRLSAAAEKASPPGTTVNAVA
ncbi:glycosyltransferase family 2 protein [Verrucomicrobium spinosum]|uniref:glycosyltransferase family 2 protein n=2 Tax=Verrucomicrobium spinosum TaxID=2736 RepID=UPI00017465CA|nr:glycosyltransferase [Verrucomicrobium spinosum]